MVFQTLLSYNIGRSLEELKWKYTIDQIYLLYEYCKKDEIDRDRMHALILAQAVSYASPAMYATRSSIRQKQSTWDKFMYSLDWEKIKGRSEPQAYEKMKKSFLGLAKFVMVKKGQQDQ